MAILSGFLVLLFALIVGIVAKVSRSAMFLLLSLKRLFRSIVLGNMIILSILQLIIGRLVQSNEAIPFIRTSSALRDFF